MPRSSRRRIPTPQPALLGCRRVGCYERGQVPGARGCVPPGSSTPEAPPKDYLNYLQGQTKDGAEITEETKITVDGCPASLMNVTRTIDASHPEGFLDGSLGCPERNADRAEGCFGPQPDLLLRLAVIDVGETTLLAWARMNKDNPDPAFAAMFERMLTSVRFR
jgi:hypothetical protein